MADQTGAPLSTQSLSRARVVTTVSAAAAGMCLIFVILAVMIWSSPTLDPVGVDPDALPPEQRLAELQADDHRKLTTYGWVDRDRGVVRIPVEQAMEKLIAGQSGKDAQP